MGYIGCDFDKTVYNGNSAIDFFLFCMKKSRGLKGFFLKHMGNYLSYLLGFQDFHRNTEKFYQFLPALENVEKLIEEFWDAHFHKLKKWFLSLDMHRVVIITASCSFLFESLQKRLHFYQYIATNVDAHTGLVSGKTNIKEEKLLRLKAEFQGELDEFYSDSKKDAPLAKAAKKAFLVKKDKIAPWPY